MAEDDALRALREAIELFAREQAPGVLAAAREQAIDRATSSLADAMTQAILEHAGPGESASRAKEDGVGRKATPRARRDTTSEAGPAPCRRSQPPPRRR